MITDCHVHITENGKWFNTDYDASLKFALNEMDRSDTSKAILLPIHGQRVRPLSSFLPRSIL